MKSYYLALIIHRKDKAYKGNRPKRDVPMPIKVLWQFDLCGGFLSDGGLEDRVLELWKRCHIQRQAEPNNNYNCEMRFCFLFCYLISPAPSTTKQLLTQFRAHTTKGNYFNYATAYKTKKNKTKSQSQGRWQANQPNQTEPYRTEPNANQAKRTKSSDWMEQHMKDAGFGLLRRRRVAATTSVWLSLDYLTGGQTGNQLATTPDVAKGCAPWRRTPIRRCCPKNTEKIKSFYGYSLYPDAGHYNFPWNWSFQFDVGDKNYTSH